MERDWVDIVAICIALGSFVWAAAACFWLSRLLALPGAVVLMLVAIPAALATMMFTLFLFPALEPSWWGSNRAVLFILSGLLLPFPILMTMMIAPVRRLRAGAPTHVHEVFK